MLPGYHWGGDSSGGPNKFADYSNIVGTLVEEVCVHCVLGGGGHVQQVLAWRSVWGGYLDTCHPMPCTLNPAPCTLNYVPYTLRPAPCTLNPVPSTLHPAPCALHPAPCALHPYTQPCTLSPEP